METINRGSRGWPGFLNSSIRVIRAIRGQKVSLNQVSVFSAFRPPFA